MDVLLRLPHKSAGQLVENKEQKNRKRTRSIALGERFVAPPERENKFQLIAVTIAELFYGRLVAY